MGVPTKTRLESAFKTELPFRKIGSAGVVPQRVRAQSGRGDARVLGVQHGVRTGRAAGTCLPPCADPVLTLRSPMPTQCWPSAVGPYNVVCALRALRALQLNADAMLAQCWRTLQRGVRPACAAGHAQGPDRVRAVARCL